MRSGLTAINVSSLILIFFVMVLASFCIKASPVFALTTAGTTAETGTTATSTAPTLKPRYLDNPLGTSSVAEIIARIISIFTGVSGSIALLMFVYGGVLWLTSAGESNKVEAGRKAMVWAVIGLIVIFGSYAILLILFNAIGASTLL